MARAPLFSRLRRVAARVHLELAGMRPSAPERGASARALPRRAFVGGAAAALSSCEAESAAPAPPEVGSAHRIAIVGAGLAGLSCAYWLSQAGVEAILFDASKRRGGRVFTLRNELPNNLFAELGGEFIDAEHACMHSLASTLGVALEPYDVDAGQRVFWVADRRIDEQRVFTELAEIFPIVNADLAAADASEEALDRLDGTPLARWFERNVPKETRSDLAALLDAAFRAEFGSETDRQSALNLLYLLGPDPTLGRFMRPQTFRAQLGAEEFARLLESQLLQAVRRESRLTRLTARSDAFTLTFENPNGVGFQLDADRVVLALPFSVLRAVDLGESGLSADKLALIANSAYGTHAKIVSAFGKRPSDNLRQVISDLPFQLVWDSSFASSGANALLTNLLAGAAGTDGDQTADAQIQSYMPDLERALMTALGYVAGSARRVRWGSSENFNGSIASPTWGQWLRQNAAGAPEGNVHFCGEHTSVDFRGSMEGAVESGALVATQILEDLSIRPPDALARLVKLKSEVPQPILRDHDARRPGPLTRRRQVLNAHTLFVDALYAQ
jgi:monoamine oxidase